MNSEDAVVSFDVTFELGPPMWDDTDLLKDVLGHLERAMAMACDEETIDLIASTRDDLLSSNGPASAK
jgi:hypothetical protein